MIAPRLLGVGVAAMAFAADQGLKTWLLDGFDLDARQPVHVMPLVDLVLAWNHGVSYSLFSAATEGGRLALLAVTLLATLALAVWLWRVRRLSTAVALGLLIGGALGNAWDRYSHGAVMDFVWIHADGLSWYIFNGADVAITLGVGLLIWESFFGAGRAPASKMPRTGGIEHGT